MRQIASDHDCAAYKEEDHARCNHDDEDFEEGHVALSDALRGPWTVMVKVFAAPVAEAAVFCVNILSCNCLTLVAKLASATKMKKRKQSVEKDDCELTPLSSLCLDILLSERLGCAVVGLSYSKWSAGMRCCAALRFRTQCQRESSTPSRMLSSGSIRLIHL